MHLFFICKRNIFLDGSRQLDGYATIRCVRLGSTCFFRMWTCKVLLSYNSFYLYKRKHHAVRVAFWVRKIWQDVQKKSRQCTINFSVWKQRHKVRVVTKQKDEQARWLFDIKIWKPELFSRNVTSKTRIIQHFYNVLQHHIPGKY